MTSANKKFSGFKQFESAIADESRQNYLQESLRPAVFGSSSSAPRNDKKKPLKTLRDVGSSRSLTLAKHVPPNAKLSVTPASV